MLLFQGAVILKNSWNLALYFKQIQIVWRIFFDISGDGKQVNRDPKKCQNVISVTTVTVFGEHANFKYV